MLKRLFLLLLALGLLRTPAEAGLARPPPAVQQQLGHTGPISTDDDGSSTAAPVDQASATPAATTGKSGAEESSNPEAPASAAERPHHHYGWLWFLVLLAVGGAWFWRQRASGQAPAGRFSQH